MVGTILLLILGLILIIKGGDWFVDAASWVAEKTKIPKVIIGATVVALATTLPEILVSIIAAAQGSTEMAIGNAAGSVTANIGLIMAIAMIAMPGKISPNEYRSKFVLMLLAAILVVIGGATGGVNLPMAVILLLVVVIFFADNIHTAIKMHKSEKVVKKKKSVQKVAKTAKFSDRHAVLWNIGKFVLGAAGIVGGAELLVSSGSSLASTLGIDERIISVTIIAIGTSLPELVTTITAIVKKQGALGYGNILGANIIDLALIMPLCAIISGKTLTISGMSGAIDLPACLIVSAVAIIPTAITKKFSRWQGIILLVVYITYLVITCLI